uniref:Malonyl CoA-acyl carrier protein transacylase n=1 Tax=candidate division WOR-3 bacterium TaxID=2052148 RepID=A0A7C4Y4B1_UNCW3
MKTALVFPGQGSQKVGMCLDIYNDFEKSRNIIDEAVVKLGFDIKDIMFNGPEETLKESRNAQVALLIHSYAVFSIIKDYVKYDALAGHSLGEYSALLCGDVICYDDALHIVRFRGELMSSAGEKRKGKMLAVIGLKKDIVEDVVKSLKDKGIITIANYNSYEQFVLSGEPEMIDKASNLCKEKGGKCIPLKVSGAFHSPLMDDASVPFKKVLTKIEFNTPKCDIYFNVTGDKLKNTDKIREALGEQITSPVRWDLIVENMIRDGIRRFIEIGSGNVVSKLIKSMNNDVETLNIGNSEEVRRFIDEAKR